MSNYSLLVADDEEIPRRHILEDISWDTLNIRPLYQASQPVEALALLLKHFAGRAWMCVAFFPSSPPKIALFLHFFLLQSIDLAPLDLQILGEAVG